MNQKKAYPQMISAMFLFGTIGLFVRFIPVASSVISMCRGFIGAGFLLLVVAVRKQKISWAAARKNGLWLGLSGIFLGFNWILLFEAYRYTTVATATLCYYMAPMIVILVSPILFREKLTLRKGIAVLTALFGMVLVSGAADHGLPRADELRGILLGLGAAALYAAIVLMNKQIHDISAYDKTILQLGITAIVMLGYCLFTVEWQADFLSARTILLLLVVGVLHTGVTYYLYFGSMEYLKAQTVAIISYIDPVVAVILSALVLREAHTLLQLLGAGLVLGAAVVCELPERARKQ